MSKARKRIIKLIAKQNQENMEDKLEIGTIVKLKSGGPSMTVFSDEVDGEIECIWFYGGYEIEKRKFKPVTLERTTASEDF